MEKQRQLTSGLPWVETFYPTYEAKFTELNRSLAAESTQNEVDEIGLTREAVEGIAANPDTPAQIAWNFLVVLHQADKLLSAGVPPFYLHYILSTDGLRLVCTKLVAV